MTAPAPATAPASIDDPILEVVDVTLRFGGVTSLSGVSLTHQRGEILAVIGPNGAGKTSLFNCITGVYHPQEGRITLHGRAGAANLLGSKPDRVTRLGVARTFQNIRLFNALSAVENVKIGIESRQHTGPVGAMLRLPRTRREERQSDELAFELLDFVGLSSRANELASSLPYGDQRRLEIARALGTRPELLLLDEPAAGTNPSEKLELAELIRTIHSRVCAHSFHAISQWALGYPDQAQQTARICVEDARALNHAFSLAHGLNMGGLTHLLLGDVESCRAVMNELYPLAERNRFPWPLTYAKFMRAWLLAQEGDRDQGIAQMLTAAEGAPAAVLQPILLTLVAEQQMLGDHYDDAMAVIERATLEMKRQHNHFYEAEMARLQGEILLAQSRDNAAQAEAGFRHAVTVAAQQSCRALGLRAATSLAQLLMDTGRAAEARDVLAPIYGAFTEGFGQSHVKAAKVMLAKLN